MARQGIARWRRLVLLAGCGVCAALPGLAVAEMRTSETAPALRASRLQVNAAALHDDRFALQARITPASSRRDVSGTFSLRTALAPKGAAMCTAGLLFQDSFESP